jgi:hypothetical protein
MNQMTPVDDDAVARRHALEEAIQRAGGIVRFAKAMRVSLQAVTLWRRQRYVPLTRAVEIEQRYHVLRETLVPADVAAALATPRSAPSDVL